MLLLSVFCEANNKTGSHTLLFVKNRIHLGQHLYLVNYHFLLPFQEKNVQNRNHFLWAHILITLSLTTQKFTVGFLFFGFF